MFIDESGFNLALMKCPQGTPLYARSPKGQRAHGQVPKNRGENSSLVAALSLDAGVCAAMTVEGAVDSIAFNIYIQHVFVPTLCAGQIVVLNHLQVHKNQAVRQAIEAQGCELLFLPPYSFDSLCPLGINPIEHAFSKLKALVRKGNARTKQPLDDALAAALETVTLQDVIGWFSYAGYLPHGFSKLL